MWWKGYKQQWIGIFVCLIKKYIYILYIQKDRTLTIWGSINIFKIHLIKEEREREGRNSISLELLAFNIVVDDVHIAFRLWRQITFFFVVSSMKVLFLLQNGIPIQAPEIRGKIVSLSKLSNHKSICVMDSYFSVTRV